MSFAALIVACGARRRIPWPQAITFLGTSGRERIERLLEDLVSGSVSKVAFAVPGGCGWPFPLYELALLTSAHVASRGTAAELTIITPEHAPLELFGARASDAVRELLAERGIGLLAGSYPAAVMPGELKLHPAGRLVTDRVVTLPRVEGPAIRGLPTSTHGFIPVDSFGRVDGLDDVYAAGDATDLPIKQGGLAAQQADAAAGDIAHLAGARHTPAPFEPVLRGLLLTGGKPRYLRAELADGGSSVVDDYALCWPPGKIVGRYLAPYLATLRDIDTAPAAPAHREVVHVEVPLERPDVQESPVTRPPGPD